LERVRLRGLAMPREYDDAQLAATVIAAMPVALTRCSADLRYVWVSDRYANWLGIPAAEIAGKPIVDVIGEAGMDSIRLTSKPS
jgi:PAS domain-containing protein